LADSLADPAALSTRGGRRGDAGFNARDGYNSAVFLGKADQLGSIDTGKLADRVLLSKDPTADINNPKSIVFVMKGGQMVDESQLPLAGGKEKRRFELQAHP
jgi:hypothetical protein